MATKKVDEQPDQALTSPSTSASKSNSSRSLVEPLSYDGEAFFAAQKKSLCSVVFVHFWGGTKSSVRRHIQFVNDLGFDAYAFQLIAYSIPPSSSPISPNGRFGVKHVYADQITRILNEVPGRKIIYAFSNPGASAIEAIAQRNAVDISGLILDSGPANDLSQSYDRLLESGYGVHSRAKRWLLVKTTTAFWSPKFHRDIRTDLQKFPKNFPVLSLQGWQDEITPPGDIEENFILAPQLNRQRHVLA